MSAERIRTLFGDFDGEQLDQLFVWGSDKDYPEFEQIGKSFNVEKDVGLFVVKHKESGEYYGLVEYNLDSWAESSSTAYEQGYPIFALTPEKVTVTQYNFTGRPTELNPKNKW